MNKIIFFGSIGKQHEYGGELTKNKEIIHQLEQLNYDVKKFDCYNCTSDKLKLVKLVLTFILYVIFHPKYPIIFSSAFNNVYPFLKILYKFKIKNRIIYWVIGGLFATRVSRGEFNQSILQMIQLYIVEGTKMKMELEQEGYDNVIVLPNFKTIGKTYHNTERLQNDKTKFFFLSRIMPEKGVNEILEAIKNLNEDGLTKKFTVDFYGNIDPKFSSEFNEGLEKYSNITYKGTINLFEERGYEMLSKYHFMLFPTYWRGEGFPGVVIDGFKAGVPIISSNWNFNEEFISNGETGLIIPPKSPKDLQKAMLKAINMSEHEFADMALNCISKVEDFSTSKVLNERTVEKIIGG